MSGKNFPDIERGDVRLVDLDEDFGEGGVDVYRLTELSQGGAEGDVGKFMALFYDELTEGAKEKACCNIFHAPIALNVFIIPRPWNDYSKALE